MRLGIVASRFNEAIAAELLERAQGTARELGVESSVVSVPGALEIPLALQWMAQSGRFDALAAVGVVIRGETYHFEIVAGESARGLMALTMDGLAVGNGILTVENEQQAIARANPKHANKGGGAAEAALALLELKGSF
ncbi:MAG: 6,7-dimethyl-8-ribityllumazine synthase [Sphingomicrobium sp.]